MEDPCSAAPATVGGDRSPAPLPDHGNAAWADGGLEIRAAGRADLDGLVALEQEAFVFERLSRRSFRQFMASPTTILRVATRNDALLGYHLVLLRRGSAAARLYSLGIRPALARQGVGRALLADAQAQAYDAGCAVMRLEVSASNERALALYRAFSYRPVERLPCYYENGDDAFRMEKPLRGNVPHRTDIPYYEQTTEFTCGPACMLMAIAARRPGFVPGPIEEIGLWRRATTVFMTSGLGGCEPQGLAVVLGEEGLKPVIVTSEKGPFLLSTVRNGEKRRVMELSQLAFAERAAALGVETELRRLEIDELATRLREGWLALLLVSGNRMFGRRVPHWLLAHHADGSHILLHDPWVETDVHETATDAANIPVPRAELERMWRWGKSRWRAAVLVAPAGLLAGAGQA